MDTQAMINDCKALLPVKDMAIMFDSPMVVKNSPHNEICRCYGVVVTKDDELKLMDAERNWFAVLPNQIMVDYVLATLLQRLKTMELCG